MTLKDNKIGYCKYLSLMAQTKKIVSRMRHKFVLSIVIVFLILSGLIYYLFTKNVAYDLPSLLIANLILASVSLLAFRIITRGIDSNDANAFVQTGRVGLQPRFIGAVEHPVNTGLSVSTTHV